MNYLVISIITCISIILSSCQASTKFTIYIHGNKGQCKFDYGEINFCDGTNQNKYQKAINNLQPNFNKNYIILNIDNSGYFVVIDPNNKNIFPLYGNYDNSKDQNNNFIKKMKIKFSVEEDTICINGSKVAYKDVENSGDFCYRFNGNNFIDINSDNKNLDSNSIDFNKFNHISLPTSSENFNICANIEKKSVNFCSSQQQKRQPLISTKDIKDIKINNWLSKKEIYDINHGNFYVLPASKKSQTIIFIDYIPYGEDEEYTDYTLVNINNGKNQILHLGEKYWIDNNFNIISQKRNEKEKMFYYLDMDGNYVTRIKDKK